MFRPVRHLFLAVIFAAILLPARANSQEKKPDTRSDTSNPAQKRMAESGPQIGRSRQGNEQPAKSKNNAQTKAEERPPFWRDPAASNWALVLVGLIAAIIAIRTLSTISLQTSAM